MTKNHRGEFNVVAYTRVSVYQAVGSTGLTVYLCSSVGSLYTFAKMYVT